MPTRHDGMDQLAVTRLGLDGCNDSVEDDDDDSDTVLDVDDACPRENPRGFKTIQRTGTGMDAWTSPKTRTMTTMASTIWI